MGAHRRTDFDVVVIGAGHNGLVAAAYLARHGFATILLEARESVGGTAASEEFGGAVVNICNCDHLAFRTTGIAEELDLASHGLDYIDIDPPQVNADWTTGRAWEMHHDVEETLDSLARVHPRSVSGYRRYAETLVPVARLVTEAASHRPSRGSLIGAALRRRPSVAATMLRMSRMSAADVMRGFFDDDAIIAPAMVEGPVVWGVSPETPGTGLGALGLALRHVQRVGRPRGGSGMLTDSLLSVFLASGGMLRTGTRVSSITCEGRRVTGVTTGDGATITATAVVSACDPRRTFVEWLRNPPARSEGLVSKWRATLPASGYESKIDAILTEPPVLRGLAPGSPLAGRAIGSTLVVGPSTAELHRGAQMMSEGRLMPRMALLANCPTVADPSLADTGRHVLSLEALYTPYDPDDQWDADDEARRWLGQFAEFVQPGFLDTVLEWRVLTPRDYESRFHLPRGHATSFAGGPLAAFLGRDRELTRYETPIEGLFVTGAATFPGAGVWGASGRNVAATVVGRHG